MSLSDAASSELPNAIAAIVRRSDGRYLLVRRAEGIPAGGYWTPVTGRLEPGESTADAAEREVREETGLRVRAGAEILRGTTADGRWRLVWHEAVLLDEEAAWRPLVLLRSELSEACWATPGEALELEPMFEATKTFFRRRSA